VQPERFCGGWELARPDMARRLPCFYAQLDGVTVAQRTILAMPPFRFHEDHSAIRTLRIQSRLENLTLHIGFKT
jgi:hypothetical protein